MSGATRSRTSTRSRSASQVRACALCLQSRTTSAAMTDSSSLSFPRTRSLTRPLAHAHDSMVHPQSRDALDEPVRRRRAQSRLEPPLARAARHVGRLRPRVRSLLGRLGGLRHERAQAPARRTQGHDPARRRAHPHGAPRSHCAQVHRSLVHAYVPRSLSPTNATRSSQCASVGRLHAPQRRSSRLRRSSQSS